MYQTETRAALLESLYGSQDTHTHTINGAGAEQETARSRFAQATLCDEQINWHY